MKRKASDKMLPGNKRNIPLEKAKGSHQDNEAPEEHRERDDHRDQRNRPRLSCVAFRMIAS